MTSLSAVVAIESLKQNHYFAEKASQMFSSVEYLKERPNETAMPNLLENYDVVIVGAKEKISSSVLAQVQALRTKVIGTLSIGLDHLDVDELGAKGVTILNTPTANVLSVAEHNVALAFALAKRLKAGDRAIAHGGRAQMGRLPIELRGKTAGLIGYGKIGKTTAAMLQSLGLNVIATSRSRTTGADGTVTFHTLETLLGKATVIFLALPLTPDSRRILDRDRLNLLSPDTILVNTSRSELIDNEYVKQLLESDRLFGFGADYDDDAFSMSAESNALLTPHVAGLTVEASDRIDNELIDRIQEFLASKRA